MGFRYDEDIERGLQQLGYVSLKTALTMEYPKRGPVELAEIFKVTQYSIARWMRMFEIPRDWLKRKKKAETVEGKPCPRGHTKRYLSNGGCVACELERGRRYRERWHQEKN